MTDTLEAPREAKIGDNSGDIYEIIDSDPQALFTHSPGLVDELFQRIENDIEGFVPELSTAKGRKEIASFAAKIASRKTTLDGTGKIITEDARKQVDKVNAVRKRIRDRLDAFKLQARKPLTDYEDRLAREAAWIQGVTDSIKEFSALPHEISADAIRSRISEMTAIDISETKADQDSIKSLESMRSEGLASLRSALTRQEQAEADAAELARIRAEREEAERLQAEKEAAEREEKLQAERLAAAKAAAKERERKAAEEAAERARAEEAKKAEEAVAAERQRAEAAEAKLLQEKQERERVEAERKRREADETHRAKVMRDAEAALIEQSNVSAETAHLIVLAIVAGNIPRVSLSL